VTQSDPQYSICMVDPTPDGWSLLAHVAQAVGYQPIALTGGLMAVEQVQQESPNLILLDTDQDPTNGPRFCELLQFGPRTRSIPIIVISSDGSFAARDRAFQGGAVAYLLKPLHEVELTHALQTQLQLLTGTSAPSALAGAPLPQTAASPSPLLATLQKRLNQQSQSLQQQNQILLQEVRERQLAEAALRAEQEKSDQLLLNVLPQAIAEQLKQGESNPAQRFEEATILFADIVGFTSLASRLPPLQLVQLLSEIFSSFDRLAVQLGLEKIKTIGDAYMVAGGVPTSQPDHAEAIMEMALGMSHEIRRFRHENNRPLRLRIGINTGDVVAGVIGLHKFSYDLWGDAVNVASRMESQGIPGKIQVTEATYQRLKHRYRFEAWGKVLIKGKGEMMTYLYAGRQATAMTSPAQPLQGQQPQNSQASPNFCP